MYGLQLASINRSFTKLIFKLNYLISNITVVLDKASVVSDLGVVGIVAGIVLFVTGGILAKSMRVHTKVSGFT